MWAFHVEIDTEDRVLNSAYRVSSHQHTVSHIFLSIVFFTCLYGGYRKGREETAVLENKGMLVIRERF